MTAACGMTAVLGAYFLLRNDAVSS